MSVLSLQFCFVYLCVCVCLSLSLSLSLFLIRLIKYFLRCTALSYNTAVLEQSDE